MYSPISTKIPSEKTVEINCNRFILNGLGSDAWVYGPTLREELKLGYDASVQNLKKYVLIQYKRLSKVNKQKGTTNIGIDTKQLQTLNRNFIANPQSPEFVFYCFSTEKEYSKLNMSNFFDSCLFVSAMSLNKIQLKPNQKSFSLKFEYATRTLSYNKNPISYLVGSRFLASIKSCKIGNLWREDKNGADFIDEDKSYLNRSLSLVQWFK